MVARLGKDSVAAVGLSFRPLFFVMSIFLGISAGTTALVARAMGSRDRDTAERITHQTLLAAVVVATGLVLGLYYLAPWIMQFMEAQPSVLPLGVDYIRSISWGLVFMYTANVATAALRGAGDTRTSMKVNIVANIVNVFFNYVLIFGHLGFPALGVKGAAIATSISRAAGGIIVFALILRGNLPISLPRQGLLRFDLSTFIRVVRVGVPAAMERILLSLAMVLHLKMIAVEGTIAVAAATLSQNIEELSHMPSIGLSVAASTLVGQFLGHGDAESAEKSGWGSVRVGLLFMGAMGTLFALAPGVWLGLYAPSADLKPLASTLLRIMGAMQPFSAIGFVLAGALRGAGDTVTVMAITAVSMWVIRLGLTYVLMTQFHMGAVGAYIAMGIDTFIRAGLTAYAFRRGRWKRVRI